MADIGLRYAAFARVQSHTEGSAITYGLKLCGQGAGRGVE